MSDRIPAAASHDSGHLTGPHALDGLWPLLRGLAERALGLIALSQHSSSSGVFAS